MKKSESNQKIGKIYAVGVGPGDPELLTLKAVRILGGCGVIAVPKSRRDGESMALGIIGKAVDLDGKKILDIHFPMVKDLSPKALEPAAQSILDVVKQGKDLAFVTLGDPSIYSTFFRLRQALLFLEPALEVEIVPGVTAITAAAARTGRGLALSGEKIAIVPATYVTRRAGEAHHMAEGLEEILNRFECVALMKVHSVFPEVKKMLEKTGHIDNAVYVCRAGLDGEVIKPVPEVEEKDLDYFSTIIVTTEKWNGPRRNVTGEMI